MKIEIRDMESEDYFYVLRCGHVLPEEQTEERAFIAQSRKLSFEKLYDKGFRVKVALLNGIQAGFILLIPIEISPAGPLGEDLLVILCINVNADLKGKGIGKALIAASEEEARRQGKKGVVAYGYFWDVWFQPAYFYEKCGFSIAARRPLSEHASSESFYASGDIGILWKTFDPSAKPPRFFKRNYGFEPVSGKVVIDLFYSELCGTCNHEPLNVREVAREFGKRVVLREYDAGDRKILEKYQIERAIYVNGIQIGWGYEAPKDGIREAIQEALERI